MKCILAIALALALSACSAVGVAPQPIAQTPAQAVFQLEGDYRAALGLELAYAKLPPCSAGGLAVCSTVPVLQTVVDTDKKAWTAILAAQNAVTTPGFDASTMIALVASATQATNAFVAISNTLKVQ